MPPVAAWFADAHLQEGAWANRPVKGDAFWSLEQIVNYAEKHAKTLRHVFCAGDGIDQQRNRPGPIATLCAALDRLESAGVEFWFIRGNHDMEEPPWPTVHRHAKHLHLETTVVGGGFTVFGFDYQSVDLLPQFLKEIPEETRILTAHQAWLEWMGAELLPQGSLEDVPIVDTVISGDLHRFEDQQVLRKDGTMLRCLSPGSTCMQEINEPPNKFFLSMDQDGKFTKVKLRTRVLLAPEPILTEDDLEEFLTRIVPVALAESADEAAKRLLPEELVKPLLWIKYDRSLEGLVRRTEQCVAGQAHLFWKPLAGSGANEKAKVTIVVPEGTAITPASVLPQYLPREQDPEVFDLVQLLLDAEDPARALASWRAEFMGEEEAEAYHVD